MLLLRTCRTPRSTCFVARSVVFATFLLATFAIAPSQASAAQDDPSEAIRRLERQHETIRGELVSPGEEQEQEHDSPDQQKSPREKALDRIKRLEERTKERVGPPPEEPAVEQHLPTVPRERTQFLLNLFGAIARIYDEILVQTGRVGQYYDDLLDTAVAAPRLLHRLLNQPEGFRFGGEYRIRYETLEGRWRRGEAGSDQQVAQRTRFYFSIKDIADPLRAVLEFQDSRTWLTDQGSFVNNTHVNHTDIQQLHVDLVSSNFFGSGLYTELNVGRLNMDLGRRRWVARNSFRNTTNAFDGISWLLGKTEVWSLRAFVVAPVGRFLRRLDEPDTERRLWGLYYESHHLSRMRTDLYYFGHRDRGPFRDFDMVGTRIRKRPAAGTFHYEIESAYQFGDVSRQGRFQHFQHAEGGFTFDAPWIPQIVLQFDYASRGFDSLYGARVFEFAPTGIFGPVVRTNLLSPGLRLLANPTDKLSLYLQQRALWLADGRSPWAGSGRHDPTGAAGTFVGHTSDLRAGYRVTDNLFLQVGFVHFAFGGVPKRTPDSTGDRRAIYAYTSIDVLF
ncbi:exported protein of unknown function [Candidatus Nitrospira inopinata]|uniref:Alginate export domain-containing protein n=1 Tax=Candidatus Nitrospira inopinata TaxID=1715989 RepID=A0A0S4KMI7_9BACT|nr:exported protein of unknown function [Candidatus Nitrospira inopinata]